MKTLRFAMLLLVGGLLATACTDDETDLGVSLADDSTLYAGIHDTLYADYGCSVINDSLITTSLAVGLVGNYTDPVFGRVKADVYSQIAPMSNEVNLASYTIDSVDLCLTLAKPGVLPDSATAHRFHIRITQLTEAVEDTTYYSYSTLADDPSTVLVDSTVDVRPYNATDSTSTRLTMRVNPAFNSRLQVSATKEDFIAQLKGIRITLIDDADDGFLAINYNAVNTVVRAYYNNTSTRFSIGSQAVRFTHFAHDYSGTVFASADSIDGSDLIYIGALAGTKGKFCFRTAIDSFHAAHPQAVVHYAELRLPLASTAPATHASRLLATFFNTNSEGTAMEYFVFDMSRDNVPFTLFDGYYHPSDNIYRLRIPQHVQYMLRSETDNRVIDLQVSDRLESMFNTVVNGANNSSQRACISLIYTE